MYSHAHLCMCVLECMTFKTVGKQRHTAVFRNAYTLLISRLPASHQCKTTTVCGFEGVDEGLEERYMKKIMNGTEQTGK